MKCSKLVSYPCDTWLILITTSYPTALQRCGLREAGGNAHASLLIIQYYRCSLDVARVGVCSGRIIYIYFVKTLEEHARSATDISQVSTLLHHVIHKHYATYRTPVARFLLICGL